MYVVAIAGMQVMVGKQKAISRRATTTASDRRSHTNGGFVAAACIRPTTERVRPLVSYKALAMSGRGWTRSQEEITHAGLCVFVMLPTMRFSTAMGC